MGAASRVLVLLTCLNVRCRGVGVAGGAFLRRTASFRQRLRNYNNVQYVGDMELGGQTVGALFDTGSDDLVVRSTMCRQCSHPTAPYNHKESETYHLSGIMHKITYGAGSCTVVRGWDTVSVGPLHAARQEIWEVTSHSMPIWDSSEYAALVGLSPTAGSGYVGGDTLLVSLGIDSFSICLQRANGTDGYLTWGVAGASGHPSARVLSNNSWLMRLGNITLSGGSTVQLCQASPCGVVLDSGHSLIEGPQSHILELSKHIAIKQDCSNLHELPTLRFELDGQPLELPPQAYVVRVTGEPMTEERVWPFLPTGGPTQPFKPNTCHPAFMIGRGTSEVGPTWVIGMPFFRHYITTFNRAAHTASFAPAAPDCQEAEASPGPAGAIALSSRRAAVATEALAPVEVNLKDIVALMEARRGPSVG